MENNYSERKQRNSSGHVTRRKKSNMNNGKVAEKQVSKNNEAQLNHDNKVTEGPTARNSSIDVCEKTGINKEAKCADNGRLWWMLFCAVSLSSFGTRLYKVDQPDHICWDETHFGKMGSWYINRTFFFDVHPPLGKMLIGLSGYLTGYNGSFPFTKPGDKYENTPYVGMRVVCACMGACLAPLSFSITWLLSGSCGAALLSAAFIILDTGVLTLSQYILLDPILMIAIMLATWSLLKFYSYQKRPFCGLWWMWLLSTGFFLACAISVKFVGLFVVLLTGVTVAWDLWSMIGDLRVTLVQFTKHFLARALCLIVLPVMFYLAYFAIHFHILNKSGNGDGFYSSAFQSQLQGNPLYNSSMPAVVAYGSIVTIKNRRTAGAYLHSHPHLYPEGIGARQQQVTTYSHKDDNNKWKIKPHNREVENGEDVQLVTSGHLVRLEHVMTRRNLHSHREKAPLSRQHYQVTCYGENGTGDINDVFRLEIVGAGKGAPLQTVRSVFKLVHYNTGCVVFSHSKQLPKWGWEQLEVACNTHHSETKALWNIEEVDDNRLPNTSFQVYGPSFFEKLIESHAVMMQGNKNLKPKEGEVSSRPWQWPINYKGQPFSGGDVRIYLLGNPVIWWLNLLVLVIFCLFAVVQMIKRQRHPDQPVSADTQSVLYTCGWLVLGWILHYLPFWSMTRILYFHHYFPAFLYSCMTSGVFIDHLLNVTSRAVSANKHHQLYVTSMTLLLAAITYSFVLFSPLSYGMTGPNSRQDGSTYTQLRWLDTWDI